MTDETKPQTPSIRPDAAILQKYDLRKESLPTVQEGQFAVVTDKHSGREVIGPGGSLGFFRRLFGSYRVATLISGHAQSISETVRLPSAVRGQYFTVAVKARAIVSNPDIFVQFATESGSVFEPIREPIFEQLRQRTSMFQPQDAHFLQDEFSELALAVRRGERDPGFGVKLLELFATVEDAGIADKAQSAWFAGRAIEGVSAVDLVAAGQKDLANSLTEARRGEVDTQVAEEQGRTAILNERLDQQNRAAEAIERIIPDKLDRDEAFEKLGLTDRILTALDRQNEETNAKGKQLRGAPPAAKPKLLSDDGDSEN